MWVGLVVLRPEVCSWAAILVIKLSGSTSLWAVLVNIDWLPAAKVEFSFFIPHGLETLLTVISFCCFIF